MNYPLIVFDWDGTLFDSTALIVRCIQAAAADLGTAIPSDAQAAYVIGMGLQEALQHAVPTFPRERYVELANRYRYHYFARQHELTLFPGTLDMLHALKARGHVLGIATGKSRRGLDEALRSVELQGLFDATRTADETASKPHPLMLHELMAEAGAAAALGQRLGAAQRQRAVVSHGRAASRAARGSSARRNAVHARRRPRARARRS